MLKATVLFWGGDVFAVIQHGQAALRKDIERLDADALSRKTDEQLITEYKSKYQVEVPTLDMNGIHVASHRETDVDVSNDPNRFIIDRSGPVYLRGTEIVIAVPFHGDGTLFRLRPSSYTSNPPMAEIEGNHLRFTYRQVEPNPEAMKADYTRSLNNINQYLEWLRSDFAQFNDSIEPIVREGLANRRQRLAASATALGGLGLPVKATQEPPVARAREAAPARRAERIRPTKEPKRWDVFISHASEDKELIERPLADALTAKEVAVWFDETSLKMGDSLRQSIDRGLANSRFGIVILSPNFFAKHWPTQELNGLAAREAEGAKVILPVWHQVTFEQVRDESPTLADRVAVRSEDGIDRIVARVLEVLQEK